MKNLIKTVFLSNVGMSLVEMTIAAGLLGGLSLGVVKVVDMQKKGQKKLMQDFSIS